MTNDPPSPEPVLVSACLLGALCRFDGCAAKAEPQARLAQALAALGPHEAIAFCPEEAGGLSTPRPPAWIETESAAAVLYGSDRLVTETGTDVTDAFVCGATGALELCRERGIHRAFMKEGSPSCGTQTTYVHAKKVAGPGRNTRLRVDHDIDVTGV